MDPTKPEHQPATTEELYELNEPPTETKAVPIYELYEIDQFVGVKRDDKKGGVGSDAVASGAGIADMVATHAIEGAAVFGPVATTVMTGPLMIKDALSQKEVERRVAGVKALLPVDFQTIPISDGQLAHWHVNPELSATDTMRHTLQFAVQKMQSRVKKLQVREAGGAVQLVGAAAAAAGSLVAGVGAIPGAVAVGVGAAVKNAPMAHAIGRAAYKKFQNTKGLDRYSSAAFILGFALQEANLDSEELKNNHEAQEVLNLASQWAKVKSLEDMKDAKRLAGQYLQVVLPGHDLKELDIETVAKTMKSTATV